MSLYGLINGHFWDKNYNRLIFCTTISKSWNVKPSHSPWNSPIFIIEKKVKGKYRLKHDL
jgi:hypothetical protein